MSNRYHAEWYERNVYNMKLHKYEYDFNLPMEAFHEYPPFDDDSSAQQPLAQLMTPP